MADNFVQDGKVVIYVNAGSAIAAGALVPMGSCVGVALVDIAATTGEGAVALEGVFTVPKVDGTAWVNGDVLSYDASTAKMTKGLTPATGDKTLCAIAFGAAASGDTTGKVKLCNPGVAN